MLQSREARALPLSHGSSDDWIKLIRKLRWIGLEEEAQRLHGAAWAPRQWLARSHHVPSSLLHSMS